MATKKDLIAKLKGLGVTVGGTETNAVLETMLAEAEAKNGQSGATNTTKPTVTPNTKLEGGMSLIWLKNRAYVNDKQRVEAGVYMVSEVPERLTKLPKSEFEVFANGEINSRKVAEIARWAGMNPDGVEDEAILEKVINPVFAPFN